MTSKSLRLLDCLGLSRYPRYELRALGVLFGDQIVVTIILYVPLRPLPWSEPYHVIHDIATEYIPRSGVSIVQNLDLFLVRCT
jgi:hypothetical protein